MSQLIAFIMENIYVVIVIVGVIYSLFFRKSAIERPPKRMPDFGRGGRVQSEQPRRTNPVNPQALERSPTESHLPVSEQPTAVSTSEARTIRVERSLQEERRRSRQEVTTQESESGVSATSTVASISGASSSRTSSSRASSSRASSSGASSAHLGAPRRSEQPKVKSVANGLRREDLARAMVWSEILGPPRARRPHRR